MHHDLHLIDRVITQLVEREDGGATNPLVEELRDLRRRLRDGRLIEVVEQGVLVPKAPTIPDGWSFDDVNAVGLFTGDLWGLRLKRGQPFVYQRGHVLFVRQFDLYDERDRPYYERISRVPGQAILLVVGYMGKREGYVAFEDGEMGKIVPGDQRDVAAWIVGWLRRAQESPLEDWDRAYDGL